MIQFSLQRIAAALRDAGLLTGETGVLPESVNAITEDSRRVRPGSLFVAVRGSLQDGHAYLDSAADAGAVAAIVEEPAGVLLPTLVVSDARRAAAVAAATLYRHPGALLKIAGVTGTNGKTTTVTLLRHLLDDPESRAASIGTLGVVTGGIGGAPVTGASLTTPGAIDLQRIFRVLADSGVRTIAMEVSSHSLDQRRVEGVDFAAAIFTTFSRDHMDYHGSMEAYFSAKARICLQLADGGVAVVNSDEPHWKALPLSGRRIVTFGLSPEADVRAEGITYHSGGSEWELIAGGESHAVSLPLMGTFNVSNALAAAATALEFGTPPAIVASLLSSAPQIPGRMEVLSRKPTVIRDYAHTPDALERALGAIRSNAPEGVIVVFGCGGDRDRGKRPEMGAIAARMAETVILTSDNPRTEDPETILNEIEAGMAGAEHERVENRHAAIKLAIDRAVQTGQTVLLAGKGHETYQIRGESRLHFDEKEIVLELLQRGAR